MYIYIHISYTACRTLYNVYADDLAIPHEALHRLCCILHTESGPLRVVHLLRHKWPGGLVN